MFPSILLLWISWFLISSSLPYSSLVSGESAAKAAAAAEAGDHQSSLHNIMKEYRVGGGGGGKSSFVPFSVEYNNEEQQRRSRRYDNFIPMTLPDGGTFLAYIPPEPFHIFYSNLTTSGAGSSWKRERGRGRGSGHGPGGQVGNADNNDEDDRMLINVNRSRLRSIAKDVKIITACNLYRESLEVNMKNKQDKEKKTDLDKLLDVPPFSSKSFSLPSSDKTLCFDPYHEKKCWKKMKHLDDETMMQVVDPWGSYEESHDDGSPSLVSGHIIFENDPDLIQEYGMARKNCFNKNIYRRLTGREYIPPVIREHYVHEMWGPGEFLGQVFYIESEAVHRTSSLDDNAEEEGFVNDGDDDMVVEWFDKGEEDEDNLRKYLLLDDYKPKSKMTMELQTVTPHIFEIPNFLSYFEIENLLDLVLTYNETRIPFSNKTKKSTTAVIDGIYQRALDLLLINNDKEEDSEIDNNSMIFTDSIDIEHHVPNGQGNLDMSDQDHDEVTVFEARSHFAIFADLIIYLNDSSNDGGEEGGTVFPYHFDTSTNQELKIHPEKGKALLVYSMLPDGNHDILSKHFSYSGEKKDLIIAKLRFWDKPTYKQR